MSSNTQEDNLPAPTFEGRLKLETFMFNGDTAAGGPRRSPRFSATPSAETATPPVAAPARASRGPSKRKAPGDDNNNANDNGDTDTTLKPPSKSTPKSPFKSPSKRARQSATYAPPSTYAHLPLLPDAIAPNLLVLFIGLNPGIQTARTGHAYAHPSNRFWHLLHSSGVTPRRCSPTEDRRMPALYSLGLTNIVARPSRNGAELSRAEMDAGVAILEAKVRRWRPEAVCVVGKSIWESLWRVRHGRGIKPAEFRYGWQGPEENMGVLGEGVVVQAEEEVEEGVVYSPDWKGARLFVASSTSGLAATLSAKQKEEIWKQLGDWVVERRVDRAAAAGSGVGGAAAATSAATPPRVGEVDCEPTPERR
ncbi:uracil-DNA glycosylase-like protein [Chaetomium fimeti]|uniref:Uracil-DNA glycosylase-like protein n=1 Tax=Chaetomium fimeti TaxID=1854472 RepID=A0AAE0HPH5_9PEZI|nr:uracil-DNA glycosylase-like protein [Chaetomium fimeti]